MFNKTPDITTLALASLYGLILISIAVYLQGALLLESSTYSFSLIKTVKYNLISSLWWYTVGYPLLLGAFFLVASVKLYRAKDNSSYFRYLVVLLSISTVGILFSSLEGVIGAAISGMGLLINVTQKHNNTL